MGFYLHRTPNLCQRIFPNAAWKINTNNADVFLTFDDGPTPEITPFVLKELDKRHIKASFFALGEKVERHSSLAREIVGEGHRLHNHSYSHPKGIETSTNKYLKDVEEGYLQISQIDLANAKLFRPPYGSIRLGQYRSLSKAYHLVFWTHMIGDFDRSLSPGDCLRLAKKNTKAGDITVFHDNEKAMCTVQRVLPDYLDFCLDQGFSFRLVSDFIND